MFHLLTHKLGARARSSDKRERQSLSASRSTFAHSQQQRSSRSLFSGPPDSHFAAPPPPAYPEEEEDLPVSPLRQLLDAINMSVLPASLRLSALAQAVEFFDHRDRAMHDAELREGGAFVLYHKLALVSRLSRCGEARDGEEAGGGGDAAARRKAERSTDGSSGAAPAHHLLNYQQSLRHSLAVQQQTEFDKEIAMICS